MEEPQEDQVRRLVLTAVEDCATCGQSFDLENVDILGQRGDLWVVTLRCPACEKRGFVAALLIDEHEAVTETVLELTPEEARSFGQAAPISARDVLEMHEFLTGMRSDLAAHLGSRHTA